jgi:hypothetical protein
MAKIKLKTSNPRAKEEEEKDRAALRAKRAEELHDLKKREVLYLRHRIQKALKLSAREGDEDASPPKDEDMPAIKENISKLQSISEIDLDILKVCA